MKSGEPAEDEREVGPGRGFWCKVRKKPKFAMLTIEDAWATAFELFAYDGRVLTPYRCTTRRTYSVVNARRIGHPNPWKFDPPYLDQRPMKRVDKTMFRPCGCWHLTRSTNHILGARRERGEGAP